MCQTNVESTLKFPNSFRDNAWLLESKGWCCLELFINGEVYEVMFYDICRLSQDAEAELAENALFIEKNIIIVPVVNQLNMEKAAEYLVLSGRYRDLVPN